MWCVGCWPCSIPRAGCAGPDGTRGCWPGLWVVVPSGAHGGARAVVARSHPHQTRHEPRRHDAALPQVSFPIWRSRPRSRHACSPSGAMSAPWLTAPFGGGGQLLVQAAVLDPSGCCSWPPTRSSPPTRCSTSPTSESRARWVTQSPSPAPRPAASPRGSVPRPGPRCSPRAPPAAGAGPPGCGGAGCGLWSAVCGLRSVVCGLWSAVCGLWSVVCGLWSVVCGLWSVVCGVLAGPEVLLIGGARYVSPIDLAPVTDRG